MRDPQKFDDAIYDVLDDMACNEVPWTTAVKRLKELFLEDVDVILEENNVFDGTHNRFFAVRELREAWDVPA